MADQKRWWKMWCSILTDDDILHLDPADRWRWVALGAYTKQHGNRGRLKIHPKNPALALIFGVNEQDIIHVLNRLPNIQIEGVKTDNDKLTVTFRNWHYYQEDSTSAERVYRLRLKRRGEENKRRIREEENKNTPLTPLLNNTNDSSKTGGFDAFWLAYPRKVGKHAVWRLWQRLKPTAALQQQMLTTLAQQKTSEQWQKEGGAFIPLPLTWLHQGRWDDQPTQVPSAKSPQLQALEAKYASTTR